MTDNPDSLPAADQPEQQETSPRQGTRKYPQLVREAFFPTPVYYRDLPAADAFNAAIKPHIYQWREDDKAGIVRSNFERLGSWHSALDMAERPEYRVLVDQILASAQIVFENLGYDPAYEPAITGMWANISPRHAFNRTPVTPDMIARNPARFCTLMGLPSAGPWLQDGPDLARLAMGPVSGSQFD